MNLLDKTIAWFSEHLPRSVIAWFAVVAIATGLVSLLILVCRYLFADASQLTELIKALVWPLVLLIGLILFRKAIGQFLQGISQRVKKFSAFHIELELSEAKEVRGLSLDEIKRVEGMNVGDSGAQIFAQLQDQSQAEYIVINLGDGEEWLSSRLLIVAALFERMRGAQGMVFLEGTGANAGRFVDPADS